MSSRSNDLLKETPQEPNSGDQDATKSTLSLTSVSDKKPSILGKSQDQKKTALPAPEVKSEPAPTPRVEPAPAAEPTPPVAPLSSQERLTLTALTPPASKNASMKAKLSAVVTTETVAQQKKAAEDKRNQGVVERFGGGFQKSIVHQAEGLADIAFGKRDETTELTSTLTGKKTGNEFVLKNIAKTTVSVSGVVKDLAADTVGLGDGKTSAAFGKAIDKTITDFRTGSAGDKADFLGQGTGFVSTLFLGGGGTSKGVQGLSTDIRAMRALINTEKELGAMGEAAALLRPAKALAGAEEVSVVAAKTATTTPLTRPGLVTKVAGASENLAARVAPGELSRVATGGGSLTGGSSLSTRLITAGRETTGGTSLLRTGENALGMQTGGTSLLRSGENMLGMQTGSTTSLLKPGGKLGTLGGDGASALPGGSKFNPSAYAGDMRPTGTLTQPLAKDASALRTPTSLRPGGEPFRPGLGGDPLTHSGGATGFKPGGLSLQGETKLGTSTTGGGASLRSGEPLGVNRIKPFETPAAKPPTLKPGETPAVKPTEPIFKPGETPAAVKPTEPVVKPGETPAAVKPAEPVVKPGETPA
ncbi:MAG: hypothetical protein K2X93_19295, partial [Candidatus Obscuribacterales bacterium]|nr:hypothetical protein [Candidatus Obscuribacterales bacterium]